MKDKKMFYIKNSFAHAILLTKKWEVLFNRTYKNNDITLKQLMVLIVASTAFETDPTIKQLSSALTTSHQNAKALLVQLEKKNHVELYTDPKDKRVNRVKVLEKNSSYWAERESKDAEILFNLFRDISLEDLAITCKTLMKLDENATEKLEY